MKNKIICNKCNTLMIHRDMVKGYLVTRVYLYHKRKDCIKMFNEEIKENGN